MFIGFYGIFMGYNGILMGSYWVIMRYNPFETGMSNSPQSMLVTIQGERREQKTFTIRVSQAPNSFPIMVFLCFS